MTQVQGILQEKSKASLFTTQAKIGTSKSSVSQEKTVEGERKYITPYNSIVLYKLDQITGKDYSITKFGKNLDKVYTYATSIQYQYDSQKWNLPDYWQFPERTIKDGTGDCEDYAILLQTLIEALFYKTYNRIPVGVSYVLLGCVDVDYDGKQDGCHSWNIIDASKLPKEAKFFSIVDTNKKAAPASQLVIVNDISINGTQTAPIEVKYLSYKDPTKTAPLYLLWEGRKWVELEPTWKKSLSYYEKRGYPFTNVWIAFNSQEINWNPDIMGQGRRATIFDDLSNYLLLTLKRAYNYVTRVVVGK